MNGLVLVDKPAGITSMQLLRIIKRILNTDQTKIASLKIGHCGTLDPLASGLMVVLLGKATQLQDEFLQGNKTYSGLIKLGLKTDTDDILGKIISENDLENLFSTTNKEQILKQIKEKFSGRSMQMPPIFSALHVSGKRSYEIARKGEIPELKPRKVEIEFLDLRFHSYSCIRFEVKCSKGTYIRALARDIGDNLECGACIQSLRRIESTPYSLSEAVSLEELKEKGIEPFIRPMEYAVSHLPRLELDSQSIRNLACGQQDLLGNLDLNFDNNKVAIFSKKGSFFGLIEDRSHNKEWQNKNWRLKWSMPALIDS